MVPGLFTSDAEVLGQMSIAWWFFVAIMPVAGIVFALDGVLLGAGDVVFLRNATILCAVLGFLPAIWLSLAYDWGLAGIWAGLTVFVVLRMVAVSWRAFSGKWAVTAKLMAVSDIHVGHNGNKPMTEELFPDSPDDWLILAGDVSEKTDDIRWALKLLRSRFAKVIWIPGNH